MKEPLVYIIILNWNGYKDTIECIESLQKINYKNYKIILIDNGSKDKSVEILKSKFSKINIVENKNNVGYAEGNNIGIKNALKNNADYILLLNNDTIVSQDFLKKLVSVSEKDKTIGIAGPKIKFYANPDKVWFAGGDISIINGPFIHRSYYYKSKKIDKTSEVDFINGCSLLIKTSVFNKVNLLDSTYFAYVEDVDFNFKVKQAGYKIIYVAESEILHKVSASSGGENSLLKDYLIARNQIIFAQKNLIGINKYYFIIFTLINRFKEIILLSLKMKFKRTSAILNGLIDGLFKKTGNYYKFI